MQLPLLQQLTTQAVNNAKERELLDKAIIGMAAMVDLVERRRAAQPNLMTTDPEAVADEALDLLRLQASAAEAERRRIVGNLRARSHEAGNTGGLSDSAMFWIAREIETMDQ